MKKLYGLLSVIKLNFYIFFYLSLTKYSVVLIDVGLMDATADFDGDLYDEPMGDEFEEYHHQWWFWDKQKKKTKK